LLYDLVINIPRFVKLDSGTVWNDPKLEIITAVNAAKKAGLTIEPQSVASRLSAAAKGPGGQLFEHFQRAASIESDRHQQWIADMVDLVQRCRHFDRHYLGPQPPSDLVPRRPT
jgi:hypothetical protein